MKSIYDFCCENDAMIILDYWDYNLNDKKPTEVAYWDKDYYWFKCNNSKHSSFQLKPNILCTKKKDFSKYQFCKQCNSIGQWFIDNYGENFLNRRWSDKNTDSPLMIPRGRNNANIWLKCENNINHPDYELTPNAASKGIIGCPILQP